MHERIDLNGTWKLRWSDYQRGGAVTALLGREADMSRALDAEVPGEVHLDLLRANLILEPTEGLNSLAARWVEECVWRYRRTFSRPALSTGQRAQLVFEGLDLAAVIYLNGREIGRHCNVFYPCQLDVTDALCEGENVLVVEVEAGLYHACDKPAHGYIKPYGFLGKRHWLRKTQSEFGWDWSTRLANVGIPGNVYLDVWSDVRVSSFVALARLDSDGVHGAVTGRLFVEGAPGVERSGLLSIKLEGTDLRREVEVSLAPGPQCLETELTVDHPSLWWPVGHGDPALYAVRVTLTLDGDIVADEVRRVGFRHVRIDQREHPESGSYFILEVNGKPIFAKGANLAPADMILARVDRARVEALVDRALEANFNFLRVWGGGRYESDDFYALCDERGLLVWQEFIFACATYPAHDEAFLEDVRREAVYQIRRLAHHASLIVWCGNNEIEHGYYHADYDKGVACPDHALYHMVLPRLVAQEDGTRCYRPSSPYSGPALDPGRHDIGDQHPWEVGFHHTDFRDYRCMTSRFPDEGGILGPNALPTVRACLPPGHEYPGSFAWEQHDNGVCYWTDVRYPDRMLEQWLGRTLESMSIEDYVYYAGILQGEGLAEYIRNFRRRMFDSAAAVFWSFNDCWPTVRSWTIVDYYLRRTPAFHPVRRAFLLQSVVVACEDGKVCIFGVNDGPAWEGHVRFGLFALAGGYPIDETRAVQLPANAATRLGEFDEAEWRRLGIERYGAFALLSRDGEDVARDRLFLPLFREMTWPAPAVDVRQEKGHVIFTSDVFAWRVCLDLDGEQPLPDNFFDVLPGIPTVLAWPDSLGTPNIMRVGNL